MTIDEKEKTAVSFFSLLAKFAFDQADWQDDRDYETTFVSFDDFVNVGQALADYLTQPDKAEEAD